ncbi:MAG: hypothetical protein RJB47_415 [Pseudomonadota bacterium]
MTIKDDQNEFPMVVGRALQSTVLIMGELGSIGSDVLKAHAVHDIAIDGWYPAKLRQEIHEAAFKRFGHAALLNFGFSMGDHYSQELVSASLEHYQQLMSKEESHAAGIDWFVLSFTNAYHQATKASQKCAEVNYGFYSKPIGPLRYEFNAVSTLLSHHQSFSEGILHGYLIRFISHQWDFELSFQPERTITNAVHSSFFWTCEFKPKAVFLTSAEEVTADYRLQIKALLFKKVLDESNAALAIVMSSVRYARLIQEAQLPQASLVKSKLKDFAVEWHPRDTIGGDFWWVHHHEPSNSMIMALVDCAGHGVPGAMLSVLVNSLLEKIFTPQPHIALSKALLALDSLLRKSLRQDLSNSESDDGCDAAFVRIHIPSQTISFAGAKINLYEIQANGQIQQHKAVRMSLGYKDMPAQDVQEQQWIAQPGSRFVMVTDGVTDQIGGNSDRPVAFGYRRMLASFASSAHGNAQNIAQHLLDDIGDWQGLHARRDDLTILAFETRQQADSGNCQSS